MKLNRHKYSYDFYLKCQLYLLDNHTLIETSKKFNINYSTLKQNLVKFGLREPSRIGSLNAKSTYDDLYFDTIDTHTKAYFLGLLLSDGYICKSTYTYILGIALKIEDKYILEKLKEELHTNVKINIYKNSCKLSLHINNHTLQSLLKYNFYEDKSHKDYIIPNIPDLFFSSFVRGYFDGDGCVCLKQSKYLSVSICCNSKIFLESLKNKILNITNIDNIRIYTYIKNRKNPLYDLCIGGLQNKVKFYNFIYSNMDIALYRKYKIFKENTVLI